MLALEEDLIHKRATYRAVKNDKRSEVQEFWDKFLSYAERLGVRDDLPGEFKMMSEKESRSSEDWPTYLFVGASTCIQRRAPGPTRARRVTTH
ncbi:hypothetical protein TWF225_007634 [Orbilia oligospora]|nr:hypothetical protein TWF225_007634 [Orbilia oligospora]